MRTLATSRTARPGRVWPIVLVAPAVVLTVVVTGSATVSLALSATGLMPLVGTPHLTWSAFATLAPDLPGSLLLSVLTATASTVAAGTGGMVIAVLILSSRPGARILAAATTVPVPVAHLVGAASVGLLLSDSGLLNRLTGVQPTSWPHLVAGRLPVAVVTEFAWKESAFVALVVTAAVAPTVKEYHEAATVLGSSARQRTTMVTVPLAMPALAASCAIVFVYTLGSYEVPWLLGAAAPEALPVTAYRLFSSIDLAARPAAAAAALTLTLLSVAALGAGAVLVRRIGALR